LIAHRPAGIREFMIATVEHWPLENGLGEYLIASARSGIKTLQELKGKTVASNATNGGCDLMIRDHIRAGGILASAMKMVVIPCPQMKAALELGTADAVCAVDPFYAAIMASPRIEPTVLARASSRICRKSAPSPSRAISAVGLARQEQDGSNRLRAGDGGGR
jgi:ABC-type taurine transport system substrate-binding protein